MEDLISQCITVLSLSPNLVGVKEAALQVKQGGSRISGKGVHMYKGVVGSFADFFSFS